MTSKQEQGGLPYDDMVADAAEIIRRVRIEIAQRAGDHWSRVPDRRTPADSLERWQPSAPRLPAKREYQLQELLAFTDADFIDNAYWVLLRRAPDGPGYRHHLNALRAGHASKVEILAALRWSAEGVNRGVHVDGLLLPYLLSKWRRRRGVGPVVGWLHSLLRLPRLADREQILEARQARESQELGLLVNRIADQIERQFEHVELALDRRVDVQAFDDLRSDLGAVREASATLQALEAARSGGLAMRIQELEQQVAKLGKLPDALGNLRGSLAAMEERFGVVDRMAVLQAEHRQLTEQVAMAQVQQRELTNQIVAAQTQHRDLLSMQGEAIDLLKETERARADAAAQAVASAHDLDPVYAAFEDRFRGKQELVRARLEPYLELIAAADAGTPSRPVVDVGSGRGEWLDLLHERSLHASGIDTNRVFIRACRDRGLVVADADAIDALVAMPDASVGAVTSLHLVEHLPFERMVELIDQARRVLQPGGLLVLETPNPENLQVASHWFYLDPTHRNPIPPETLRWLVEARGFSDVRIERQTVAREFGAPELLPDGHPDAPTLNSVLGHYRAAPDYAIVARRA